MGDNVGMDLGEVVCKGMDWIGTTGGLLWHGKEPSGFVKGGKFLDCLSDY
jgi:hypothetical protein